MNVTTKSRRRWTDATIEAELRAQFADLGHFPTRAELVSRGLRALWDAMRADGGVDRWCERFAEPRPAASEEIAVRAYHLYERGVPGGPIDHWLAAERDLAA